MSNEQIVIRDMRSGAGGEQPREGGESVPVSNGSDMGDMARTEQPYQCPDCGRGFDTINALNVHARSHNVERIPCPECGEFFQKGPGLSAHRRSAHGVPPKNGKAKHPKKICPECSKPISAKDLTRHRRTQHGVGTDAPVQRGRPPKIERTEWDVDDIFNTVVEVLWPKGLVPVKAFTPLMHWREATAKMLIEVAE